MILRRYILLYCLVCGFDAEVSDSYNDVIHSDRHHITKRDINRNVAGFSHKEKMAILKIHNFYRSREGASNMLRMSWNEDLEELAQSYAEECIFKHSTGDYRHNVAGFTYIGENLFTSTDVFQATYPVLMWWNETHAYNYDSTQCLHVCTHYTQIVWGNSHALGCGVKYCPILKPAKVRYGYNVVCHYGPGGNYAGKKPYNKGKACSDCPAEMKYCYDNLCALLLPLSHKSHFCIRDVQKNDNCKDGNNSSTYTDLYIYDRCCISSKDWLTINEHPHIHLSKI